MDSVAKLASDERAALFRETAAKMGLGSSVIPEKDFWVCFALHHLFALEFSPTIMFKGGTSLSKAFGLIERFSEDIDLTLNREELGFGGENDPADIEGGNARKRKIVELATECGRVVVEELQPALIESMAIVFGDVGWALESDLKDDGQVNLRFQYPRGLSPSEYGGLAYIRPEVLMEFGARSDQDPATRVSIKSYAADLFPDYFEKPETEVLVLAAERTFWEKATIFHAENHRPESDSPPNQWRRLSRHAYDLFKMERADAADRALDRLHILADVAAHKRRFYPSGWANYEEAAPGTFRLVPGDRLEAALRRDYEEMKSMLFGDAPDFDEILEALRALEDRINAAT